MNVALLACEATPAYDRLFRDLLDRASGGSEITLHPYDVYAGHLPASVHDHAGYLITGSYAGAYEDLPWIPPLLDFVRAAHAVQIPLVGVCFGHQVLAQALGGEVEKATVGWELGVHSTRITRRFPWMAPDDVAGDPPDAPSAAPSEELQLIYVHQDQVTTLPPHARVFATTELCPAAGFVLGNVGGGETGATEGGETALGIQGHPEFTRAVTAETIRSQPKKFPPAVANPALHSLESLEDSYGRDSTTVAGWIVRFLRHARGYEIDRLSAAIRFETVHRAAPGAQATGGEGAATTEAHTVFDRFEAFLWTTFPRLHEVGTVEAVGDPGLLYTWAGSDPDLAPLLFLAHYDVVPADEPGWRYPPFSGAIADGCVWGRGTLDDKGLLMALLEATERLLGEGFAPRRTIMIALGGDEETSGLRGAARIAGELARRGMVSHATFDEGSIVAEGMLPFVKRPLALIGTAEKGYLDVTVAAEESGGHAAMPGRHTALGRVARAVTRITRRGFVPTMPRATAAFLQRIGRTMGVVGFPLRHPRLCAPILYRALGTAPTSSALVRTTVAPTMARGSAAPNVLPARAEMTLNLRLLPGTDRAAALARLRRLAGAGEGAARADTRERRDGAASRTPAGVTITELPGATDPVPDSPVDTPLYRVLENVTAAHFPTAIVTPFLVTVTTDSRHYCDVSAAIYRFIPIPLDAQRLATIHGINERIAIQDYRRAISWYHDLIGGGGELGNE